MKTHGGFKDSEDTVIINAVFQSGMAMLLYTLKKHFKHFLIVGHPTTLLYCEKVFDASEFRHKVSYVRKLNFNNFPQSVIISDSQDVNCDLWMDFDYYDIDKRNGNAYIFPYYRSPARHYVKSERTSDRLNPIKCRIFFGGAIPVGGYPNLAMSFPEMINRTKIIDYIKESYKKEIVEYGVCNEFDNKDSIKILLALNDKRRGDTKYPIEFEDFEEQLAVSDFFIAPPGNGMPHCHNIMEALYRGSIPITNYADWFYPELEDGINCLSFHGIEELNDCVKRALAMSDAEIVTMREKAKKYYETYCSSDAVYNTLKKYFGKRKRKMMLVNDEGNTIALQKKRNGFK